MLPKQTMGKRIHLLTCRRVQRTSWVSGDLNGGVYQAYFITIICQRPSLQSFITGHQFISSDFIIDSLQLMKNIFSYLDRIGLASMQDPKGISGYISPCSTATKLADAKSKLSTALNRAQKARDAENKDDIKEAFEWWNLLYNYNFPSYYY